ncbi:MAG: glycosyltransferase family 2 protein [Xanthobacteraceae bacterium]
MDRVSAYILAYNEAEKIAAAVASVLWADEVVVADSGSTDGTAAIAQSLGARVVQIPFTGFGDLRNRAVAQCRSEWIFSLDADERCTDAVRDEILAILASPGEHEAYLVPRRNYMMGRWIKGSGWYPNFRQPQLFRKGAMRYGSDPVHEGYALATGKAPGILQNAIWQFPFRNLEEIINKMNRYSSLGVAKLTSDRMSMWSALGHGVWAFVKHYLLKRGYRDGWAGFVIALGNFEGTFYRYAKKYEQLQAWAPPPPGDHAVTLLYDPAGEKRVLILQRSDGRYGYEEERFTTNSDGARWIRIDRTPPSLSASAEIAEREARKSVGWLKELGPDLLVRKGCGAGLSSAHASSP